MLYRYKKLLTMECLLISVFFQYNDDTVLQIRNFLEVLGETYAVQTIDNMAKLSFV